MRSVSRHNFLDVIQLVSHQIILMQYYFIVNVNLPRTINETPTHILNKIKTHSIHRITTDMKLLYIDKYEGNCIIQNCYICNKD